MKNKSHISARTTTVRTTTVSGKSSLVSDIASLTKAKLLFIVVLSSIMSYMIVAGSAVSVLTLVSLAVGGTLITASANALNQVLEKDYDALMKRTENRPLVKGTMTTSTAVLIAGLSGAIGLITLAWINPIVSMLGAISLMLYAFVYTPLKRFTTLSVAIGAIPGALPVLIGTVAFDGTFTLLGLFLFSIQFFWQFPHFWAIGYRSFGDYRKAGFELVPYDSESEEVDGWIGKSSLIYSIALIGAIVFAYAIGVITLIPFVLSMILGLGYVYFSQAFSANLSEKTATSLMLYSFGFMPIFLLIFIIF